MVKTINEIRQKKMTIVITILLLLSVQLLSARPIFGNTSSTTTEQCGECMCTWVNVSTYVFWIKVDSSRELVGIDCN